MQKKYHLFKRSLIVNWINENKDDKYISNNVSDINIQMLEDYNIKNNLIKFNIDNVYYELTKSKDNNFYIFYDEIDSTKMLLDELERTINKIGVEKYIDDLFAFYKDREIKYEDISNYYNIFKILEFWFYRWESMSDSFFMTKTIIKNDIETTVQIHKKDVNMYQHIRSQFCLMHKLGLSNENNFNFKNIPFKSRVSWVFNSNDSSVYVVKHKFCPLLSNPIFVCKMDNDPFFYFQLSPFLTIIVLKNKSKFKKDILENYIYRLYIMTLSSRSYSLYFSNWFYINDYKTEEFRNFLVLWTDNMNARRDEKLDILNTKSSDKNIFCYNIVYLIYTWKKISQSISYSNENNNNLFHYNTAKSSIIFFKINEIEKYERKVNNLCSPNELKIILYNESKKISQDKVTQEEIEKHLSFFNFQNK